MNNSFIPFNKPYLTGKETEYITTAVHSGKISGDGIFTKKCHGFFEGRFGFKKALLTTSCTDALEMAAILMDIKPGDEVIVPSYSFVSSANPFILRGAKVVFADSYANHPNIDATAIEPLINKNTKAIVPVHYGGVACDMELLGGLAKKYNLFIVEDAAHSVDSYYRGRALGSVGQLGAFSFHETKNLISGEGGMLVINDERFIERAEIIREKGTNRSKFFRGEIDKYEWVDIGSSFLPSEVVAAFLYAQVENIDLIQQRRKHIWQTYYNNLKELEQTGLVQIPDIPAYATNNGSMFYMICSSLEVRTALISFLKERKIHAVFHYLSLHKSQYYHSKHDGRQLPNADRFSDCLVRLPFYFELTDAQLEVIIAAVREFIKNYAAVK